MVDATGNERPQLLADRDRGRIIKSTRRSKLSLSSCAKEEAVNAGGDEGMGIVIILLDVCPSQVERIKPCSDSE